MAYLVVFLFCCSCKKIIEDGYWLSNKLVCLINIYAWWYILMGFKVPFGTRKVRRKENREREKLILYVLSKPILFVSLYYKRTKKFKKM